MRRPIKVSVIGCGRAAQDLHLPALGRISDVEVAGLADPNPHALDAAGEGFGIRRRTDDYRELLEDGAIDVACIATPTKLHAEVALAALEAGKHLLVEKPLALSLDDCDLLVERAARSGLKAMVGFNLRWHRHVRRARELVRRGRLGDLKLLRSAFTSANLVRADLPRWRVDLADGGGILAIAAVHHLDLWRFLLSEEIAELYCAASGRADHAAPATAAIVGSTPRGVRVAGAFCAENGNENGFAIYGTEAWLGASLYRFEGPDLMPRDAAAGDLRRRVGRPARFARELVREVGSIRRGGGFAASYEAEWRNLVDAIRHDAPLECGLENGREVTRALLAAQQAAVLGRKVRLAEAPRALPVDHRSAAAVPSGAARA
jgi:myo-inositol 2-dehydrogenase / D-chiro-inositol 1-dehydrogenase